MLSLEKLLFVLNHLAVSDAEGYFKKIGYVLESSNDGRWLFTKKIKADRADVISLEQADTGFNSISHISAEDKNFSSIFDDAISKFGFEVLENNRITTLLGTKHFDLFLMRHNYPPFKSFSTRLKRVNKDKENFVIEVILNPPPQS